MSGFPNNFVAIGRHDFQNFQFLLHHHKIGLSLDELQARATSEDTETVGGSVDVVPDVVLGEHGFSNIFEAARIKLTRITIDENTGVEGIGNHRISMIGQMHAIDRRRRQYNGSISRIFGSIHAKTRTRLTIQIAEHTVITSSQLVKLLGVMK